MFFGRAYMFFGGAYDDYLWGAKKEFNDLSHKRCINIERQPRIMWTRVNLKPFHWLVCQQSRLYYYHFPLYWLDEYGSMQQVPYGVHGVGSILLLSILDCTFRPNITLPEAAGFDVRMLSRVASSIWDQHSPQEPCLKCIYAQGIHWIPFSDPSNVDKS
jgi:hypothetical protein